MLSFLEMTGIKHILHCYGNLVAIPTTVTFQITSLSLVVLSSYLVQCFLGMLPSDPEDSDKPIRTLKCLQEFHGSSCETM